MKTILIPTVLVWQIGIVSLVARTVIRRSRQERPQRPLGALLFLLLGTVAPMASEPANEIYSKRDSLPDTLLATRSNLQQWLIAQQAARAEVRAENWMVLGLKDGQKLDAAGASKVGSPLASSNNALGLNWQRCPQGSDGAPEFSGQAADFLGATLVARKAVKLTIELSRHETFGGFAYRPPASGAGVRSSDPLLWLDGRQVELRDRLDGYSRVPVAKRRGWHDAVLVDLPLQEGQNRLVVSLGKDSRSRWFNRVRLVSNPVQALWAMAENDFPRSQNHFLEKVQHTWFDPAEGWFLQGRKPRLEEDFLEELIGQLGAPGRTLAQRRDELTLAGTPSTDRRWLDLCVAGAELAASLRTLDGIEAAIRQLETAYPNRYPAASMLDRTAQIRARLLTGDSKVLNLADSSAARLWKEIRDLQREALVTRNPLLAGKELLFVKRATYDSDHYYDEFNAGIRRFGGGLQILAMADGRVRPVSARLGDGLTDRYDLSFDAQRIVFDYKPPKPEGFRIYEIGADGSDLRQLTVPPEDEEQRIATYATCSKEELRRDPSRYGHWTDDMHPCYLPDGCIVFTSTRSEQSVLCGGHSLTVANLHQIDADGRNLRRLSRGALSEFAPAVLSDGRLVYNRWEYVDKGAGAVQSLWAMCPDGSRSEEVYGNNITTPPVFTRAQPVPGASHLLVCLGTGHCPGNMGAIVLLDLRKNKRSPEAMDVLTPDSLPKGNWGLRQFRNGQWMVDVYGPWYSDPSPLGEETLPSVAGKFFLVSCNPEGMWNDPAGYGIYLLDVFGNRVLIHRDAEMSCWQPRLLEPRAKPPVSVGSPPPAEPVSRQEATVVISDIYQGLEGVPRGTVKHLRVMEQVPRPWSVYKDYQPNDSAPGQMVAVSLYAHLSVRVLHGIVPVHDDGSACFTVPADRDLYLQALDKDFMEIQRMRTFVNFRPGERRSCIGCHETRNYAPSSRQLAALESPPARLTAQPGEVAPRPIHYPVDVQPVFDRHCVSCHNSKKTDGGLDLSGDMTPLFNRSYEAIIRKDLVGYIQEFIGPKPEGADAMGYAAAVPPYTYGSHKSKLIAAIQAGHYDVKLPREDFIKLVTWVDANAPYYGTYFGRRNLVYRNQPGFRPIPTLESALGFPPVAQAAPQAH